MKTAKLTPGQLKVRYALIDKFEKVLTCGMHEGHISAECANIAEEYASQSVNPMTEEEMGDWLDKIALTDSPNDLLETLWLFQQHLLSTQPKDEKK